MTNGNSQYIYSEIKQNIILIPKTKRKNSKNGPQKNVKNIKNTKVWKNMENLLIMLQPLNRDIYYCLKIKLK